MFVRPYLNGPRDNLNLPEFTPLQTAGAFDEGGNFIQVTFGPLTLLDTADPSPRAMFDYHLQVGSPAINAGSPNSGFLGEVDFDNDPRPITTLEDQTDIGADELP
jgi:hypothetical protein